MLRPISFRERCEEVNDDTSDDDEGSHLGEKKRRLNPQQVKGLEKSFDQVGNKLEPERKRQLARALGLQPRQVAIWFQNRRARWKIKQLEKDYNVLKTQVDSIRADNDELKNRNNRLHAQLTAIKSQESDRVRTMVNLNIETEGSWSNGSDNTTIFYTQILNNLPADSSVIGGLAPPYLLGQPLSQTVVTGDEETFGNLLNVIEDQPPFWPWPEAH